ncbi:hypothetical protein Bca52824_086493 [Brassica carinata]|uniref:Ubiquitin-like protease family profile domain-containing protein n=1 Tax=Brassica carinata TaxID=52824 RepID=A0A8X7P8X1_BRACI|nr:hypothetical protein Bca52824_086493 [Brassica carinata]
MMLPDMMFADGEEPVGVRVLTYQSSHAINSILNALDEEEIQFIRESSFGKLVDIGEKPGFSVEKKHEAWFRFADKPIRFSLREFAIVIGLPCGEFPKKQKLKKKKKINDKPYWPELFGSVEEMRSDSDEDDVDRGTRKTKKKTLSLAHAREVDKKESVLVRSIIPQDPARLVDEFVLVWSDEVVDIKVSFMFTCINDNHVFTKNMFRGGVTKADVERMREKAKTAGKKKGLPKKAKDPPVGMEDESIITSIVNVILRPELNRIDGDIADVVSSLKEVSVESVGYEKKVIAIVEGMFQSFKTEMMKSMPTVNTQSPVQPPKSTEAFEGPADEVVPRKTTPVARDGNDEIIDNVMENLKSLLNATFFRKRMPHHSSRSAHSQTHEHFDPIVCLHTLINYLVQLLVGLYVFVLRITLCFSYCIRIQLLSFSLGLTHELGGHHDDNDDDEMGENEDQLSTKHNGEGVGDGGETLLCRKSKRLRTVPPQLLTDYQCESAIVNRAREGQIFGNGTYDLADIHEKYFRLKLLLRKDCVINVAGLSVTGKASRTLENETGFSQAESVMDILMRVVSACVNSQICATSHTSTVFLDCRLQVLLSRKFPKFRRAKSGTPYIFTKALVDMVMKSLNSNTTASRFYMPLTFGRKHWIGICVDFTAGKIYVLDCNPELMNANGLTKELAPVSEMFPSLLKHCVVVETVKGVVHNTNPAEAAMTACLLIHTHALYGPQTCSSITPLLIPDEAQRAAVMIYEFHKKL